MPIEETCGAAILNPSVAGTTGLTARECAEVHWLASYGSQAYTLPPVLRGLIGLTPISYPLRFDPLTTRAATARLTATIDCGNPRSVGNIFEHLAYQPVALQ